MTRNHAALDAAVLAMALGVAALVRLGAVLDPLIDFDADEAVVGLMARDILAGGAWPVYYAGQGYLAAVEAWAAALAFGVLGPGPRSLRLVPLLFTLGFLVVQHRLMRRFFPPRAAGLILLWTALGTPYLALWGVKARGGFAETLLFASWWLLLFDRGRRDAQDRGRSLWALGAVTGCGYAINPLLGAALVVPLALLFRSAVADVREGRGGHGWRPLRDMLPPREAPSVACRAFTVLALLGVGLAAVALALLVLGDITVERPIRIALRNGTRWAAVTLLYLGLLSLGGFLIRRRPGWRDIRAGLREAWARSASLRLLTASVVGMASVPLVATIGARMLGGGGYTRPFRLAPMVTWPDAARLLLGEIVPTVLGTGASPVGALVGVGALSLVLAWTARRVAALAGRDPASPGETAWVIFGGTSMASLVLVATSAYTTDATAARYLMPLLVSLPATAFLVLADLTRRAAAVCRPVLLTACTVALALASWSGPASLRPPTIGGAPDVVPIRLLLSELEARRVRRLEGDYWTVYLVAFLARGGIAVAPVDGVDRFPAMSAAVRSVGADAFVFREGAGSLAGFRASPQAAMLFQEVVSIRSPAAAGFEVFYRRKAVGR